MSLLVGPASRQDLKDYAMRALGSPVINVEVSDDQLEDRLNEAINMFRNWHHAGMTRGYLRYQLQAIDLTNQFIPIPEEIIEITKILPYQNTFSSALFSALHYAKYTFMFAYSFAAPGTGQIYP